MMEPIIAGNWKMHKEPGESRSFVQELMALAGEMRDRITILIPAFTSLPAVSEVIRNTRFKLGAQNMHWERSGAYTGEVSGMFLKALGCEYVVIGHSERRHIMGETDEMVNRKMKTALEIGLIPIMCVGEKEAERDAGKTEAVIERQVEQGLKSIENEAHKIILAYEPVWAIGTGKTATPEQAAAAHAFIRSRLKKPSTILYGGSVKPDNIDTLMKEKEIQGVLVGGASLDAESFARIVKFQ
ncbi:triose-phosphate isomerase [candidate division WOR-3 bacterium]|nr:triose-phosphate isomerase [candidate division WOR-3 bacterium]